MLYASGQLSAGVSYCNTWKYLGDCSTFTAGVFNALTVYTAKYGTLIAGKQVFVKIVQCQSGMQDNGTVFSGIVGT
jgi:hypothetical protein